MHQPLGATAKPANKVQAPDAAVKNWQLAQALPTFLLGSFEAAPSGTYLSALAVALSAGSFFSAWANDCPNIGRATAAVAACNMKRRREFVGVMVTLLGMSSVYGYSVTKK